MKQKDSSCRGRIMSLLNYEPPQLSMSHYRKSAAAIITRTLIVSGRGGEPHVALFSTGFILTIRVRGRICLCAGNNRGNIFHLIGQNQQLDQSKTSSHLRK